MMMKQSTRDQKRAVVHVGIHKTGSTSLQTFLHINRERLSALGIQFFQGDFGRRNHVELHLAAMRAERMSPVKMRRSILVDEEFRERVTQRVQKFISQSSGSSVVFSAEGLSYLRYEDEMERLKSILSGTTVNIIVYLREPKSYLASYRAQLERSARHAPPEKYSFADTSENSWLIRFDERVAQFQSAFGSENVTVLDYDQLLRNEGNVIPSFLRLIGAYDHFRPDDWSAIFLNRSSSAVAPG